MTEAIAIAWDAYLDSGRNITDPVFVRCVQAFAGDDRWAIIRGVPALMSVPLRFVRVWPQSPWFSATDVWYWHTRPYAPVRYDRPQLIVKEWARFRLGCLQVWAAKREFYSHTVDAGGRSIGDTCEALVAGEIGVEPVSACAIALYNAERHHWCGMIGRPKDDELIWIRRHLDTPYRYPWPQGRLSRSWWFYDDKWDIRAYWDGTRARMIATLDRWETVTDEERAKWTNDPVILPLTLTDLWSMSATSMTLTDANGVSITLGDE